MVAAPPNTRVRVAQEKKETARSLHESVSNKLATFNRLVIALFLFVITSGAISQAFFSCHLLKVISSTETGTNTRRGFESCWDCLGFSSAHVEQSLKLSSKYEDYL